MTFRVGQKVVCVDPVNDLVKDEVYTVSAVSERHVGVAESRFHYPGGAFFNHRFRPIVERKADISIFTKMLTPEGVGV